MIEPKSETVSLFEGRLRDEEGRLGIRAFRAVIAPSRENAREVLSVCFHDDFFTVRVRIQVDPPASFSIKNGVTRWSRRRNLFTTQFPRIARVLRALASETRSWVQN